MANKPVVKPLDLADPLGIRAEMARNGLIFDQLLPYDDPERGTVDPLDDPDVRHLLRQFVGRVWRAALVASAGGCAGDARERPTVADDRTNTAIKRTPRIVGYRCLDYPEGGVIPLASYAYPCGNDVPVWSDGHEGERDDGSEAPR